VQCTKDTEETECGSKACRLSDGTCTDTDRGTVLPCRECDADSECTDGSFCVVHEFDQQSLGPYCFWVAGTNCSDIVPGFRPYSTMTSTITSIDGNEAIYCLPPTAVTCTAIVNAEDDKSCSTNIECSEFGHGGYCPDTGEAREGECSYWCAEDYDCPTGLTCPDTPPQYCQ
jgi:hypothetical protein